MNAITDPAITEPALPRLASASMDIGADVTRTKRNSLAWTDFTEGAALWRLGATLGWLDIKLKYRGSLLGPFWLTISTAVWIGAMGGLYSVLFHQDLHIYLPFLALSLVTWNALGGLVSDACTTFTQAESTIRSLRMPFFVHALRVVVRTAISFAHNLPVIVAVFAIFSIWPGFVAAQSLFGFALWTVDGFAACLLLGQPVRALPRHPADRRQHHADCLLHHAHRLAAGAAGRAWLVAALQPLRRAARDGARAAARRARLAAGLGAGARGQRAVLRTYLVCVRAGADAAGVLDMTDGLAPAPAAGSKGFFFERKKQKALVCAVAAR